VLKREQTWPTMRMLIEISLFAFTYSLLLMQRLIPWTETLKNCQRTGSLETCNPMRIRGIIHLQRTTWDILEQVVDHIRYRELRARLVELSQRREQQRQRLAQYTHVETLIEPFRDAQNNIQPNLLTRDGELLQELDKMRMLVARVTGRVGQSRPAPMEEVKEVHPSFLSASERLTKLMETT
jgi:hypothetical protein